MGYSIQNSFKSKAQKQEIRLGTGFCEILWYFVLFDIFYLDNLPSEQQWRVIQASGDGEGSANSAISSTFHFFSKSRLNLGNQYSPRPYLFIFLGPVIVFNTLSLGIAKLIR